MRSANVQFRTLALLCGAAICGLVFWGAGLRRVPPRDATRAGGQSRAVVDVASNTPPELVQRPARSDSELARVVADYGALLRGISDSVASFYFVTLDDSSTSLSSLGFMRASTLLDSTAEFDAYGDTASTRFHVASRSAVDSAFRHREDGCVIEVPVPVRPTLPPGESWVLALTPGSARVLPSSEWRIPGDSLAQRTEALHFAESLPMDTSAGASAMQAAQHRGVMATTPLDLVAHYRFVVDGVEIMIVETHRAVRNDTLSLEEERLLIAERDASDQRAAFKVTWHTYSVDDPDQLVTETPLAMLRLGRTRLLTLFTDGHYRDGGGGLFIARTGRGKWRTVASWYTGC
ncbi:MAG TPA: hypothetical protein VGQ56_13510 [Gemmatimonadaceae bacterium]|jgi:hypothetical protein|nr:hypothetical protein [Gemmatimonadaceae bacterium]